MRTCLLSVCLALVAFVCDASQLGTLEGEVTDPTGAVIAGAIVRAQRWSVEKSLVESETVIHTDAKGRFSTQLEPGLYDVFISSALFSPIAKKVKIETQKPVVLNPELKFDPVIQFVK